MFKFKITKIELGKASDKFHYYNIHRQYNINGIRYVIHKPNARYEDGGLYKTIEDIKFQLNLVAFFNNYDTTEKIEDLLKTFQVYKIIPDTILKTNDMHVKYYKVREKNNEA